MDWRRAVIVGVVGVIVIMTITLMAVLFSEEEALELSQCPRDYPTHPLLLISMDGFRADYLARNLTPTLQKLADEGVHAPFMKPSYPSLTFPNHYSIVTGLYPESHGIIANSFYDPDFKAQFSLGSEESLNGRWWGGEPIWNTLHYQNITTATYFWPGSDANISGLHPNYWVPFDEMMPFSKRVDQVVKWLLLPEDKRPAWVSLYFNEPDHTGHSSGPNSDQVNDKLKFVDQMLKRLLDKLETLGLIPCVNIIVVADHGMASAGENRTIDLVEYIEDIKQSAYIYSGAFGRIDPKNDSDEVKLDMMAKLANKMEEMRVYERGGLPTRLHYANNRRIEDIVLDLDPGYIVYANTGWFLEGEHGYDNYFASMNALFIASGPDFINSTEIEPFQNIELYNLMCHLTGVQPADNNGTEGSLYHILANPPDPPTLPPEEKPPTSVFPEGNLDALLNMTSCDCSANANSEWLQALNMTEVERNKTEALHLPWGLPLTGSGAPGPLTLLHQQDHITGYSETLRMPLWTSFTLDEVVAGTQAEWCSDVRLNESTTATCNSYNNLASQNINMTPLFPPAYSKNASQVNIAYLVSNAVPVSNQLAENWNYLLEQLVESWLQEYGFLNVVLGPVFDKDADSHPDNVTSSSTPDVVSHLFAVVTRCKTLNTQLNACPYSDLDAVSFILPQVQPVSNHLVHNSYALEFSAKVRDVEIATGLTFYPNIDFHNRIALALKIHSNLWSQQSMNTL